MVKATVFLARCATNMLPALNAHLGVQTWVRLQEEVATFLWVL